MPSALEMERARKLMALGVKPYEGSEPYIFISYAHKDFDRVIPTVKALIDQGFRVWYDEGIDPGTEWDANIADHVENCYCMLSFLSANYLASNNCLDELSYARDLNKEQLFVYLEELKLPGRLALRFGRLQAIFQHTYANQEQFYEKLFSSHILKATICEVPTGTVISVKAEPAVRTPDLKTAIGSVPTGSVTPIKTDPAVRTLDLKANSAPFECVQIGKNIIITKLRDKDATSVKIPWGVTDICGGAFSNCSNLKSITLPDSLTLIGDRAFSQCTSLAKITIPNSVTDIGKGAFSDCTSLTNITIPGSVTSIEESAFSRCTSLTSISIQDGVTSIEDWAFSDCTSLSSITIPDSVTSIGEPAFPSQSWLTIYAKKDSYAEMYAMVYDIPFQPI